MTDRRLEYLPPDALSVVQVFLPSLRDLLSNEQHRAVPSSVFGKDVECMVTASTKHLRGALRQRKASKQTEWGSRGLRRDSVRL